MIEVAIRGRASRDDGRKIETGTVRKKGKSSRLRKNCRRNRDRSKRRGERKRREENRKGA